MRLVDLGIAAVGGLSSNLLLRLPFNTRLAVLRTGLQTMTRLMKTRPVQRLYLDQNRAHRSRVVEASVGEAMTAIPSGQGQQVSLFYSGGADSTYAAVLLAREYDRVHLLTFSHDGMAHGEKAGINAARLQKHLGDRFVWHMVDGNDLWHRLYLDSFEEDRRRYGAFLNTGACECCYLSWNAITAVYNRRNGIGNLAVGIDREHSGFMYSAGDDGIEAMRRFHADYGVRFFMPVYHEPAADVRLYEMGITAEKHTKRPYQFYTTATTQGTCEFGLGHRLYAQYTVVRHSPTERQARAAAYFANKLAICRDYVSEALEQDQPLPLADSQSAAQQGGAAPAEKVL